MIIIKDWNKHFEAAQSRPCSRIHWVAMPNKRGYGYTRILNQDGGESLFGAWCALVELASTCTPRGQLQSNGTAYSYQDISALTLYSEQTISSMIDFCKSLGWIVLRAADSALSADYECTITTGQDRTGQDKTEQTALDRSEHSPPPDENKTNSPPGFDDFWNVYPNKVGKLKAAEAWRKLKPPLDQVLANLAWRVSCPKWKEENGKYIPHPTTWINGGRWLDEQPTKKRTPYNP